MLAYQFLARDRAGLQLVGQDSSGELEWIGTMQEWDFAERLENNFETDGKNDTLSES